MTLENIVPPLADCQRIPQGAFKDSALVWMISPYQSDKLIVIERWRYGAGEVYPAPTLAEILAEIADIKKYESTRMTRKTIAGWKMHTHINGYDYSADCDPNPATAALRLWLKLKGVQG